MNRNNVYETTTMQLKLNQIEDVYYTVNEYMENNPTDSDIEIFNYICCRPMCKEGAQLLSERFRPAELPPQVYRITIPLQYVILTSMITSAALTWFWFRHD